MMDDMYNTNKYYGGQMQNSAGGQYSYFQEEMPKPIYEMGRPVYNLSNAENRTLYVGNLDCSVSEDLIKMLFGQLGEVRSCKMFREPTSDPYCFVELSDHSSAINAISMMNDKVLCNRKIRVDWATGQGTKTKYTKVDTSNHFHIYVGDLSPEINEQALKEAFQVFGEISDCKIVKDPQSFKSRGYGFVVFVKKTDAENAISSMNGQWLGRKMIKARWATRKPNNNLEKDNKKLSYEEVVSQTTPTNTTVFCGGLKSDVMEDALSKHFSAYGQIEKVKIFKEKGYAFIKYSKKESAAEAIVDVHNSTIDGQIVRCSWGKDTGPDMPQSTPPSTSDTPTPSSSSTPQSFNGSGQSQGYNNQMGGGQQFWPSYYQQQMGYNQMGYGQYYPPNQMMWMGYNQQQQTQQQGWGGAQAPPSGPPFNPQQQ